MELELGVLTEELREIVEGKSLPVGTFVKRKSGTYRKGKDGRWGKVRKIKVKVPRNIKNVGSWKTKGGKSFRKTRGGGWAKSVKYKPKK